MITKQFEKKINKSLVRIIAEQIECNPMIPFIKEQPNKGQGTGFFINKNSEILTCAHVINGSKNIYIELPHHSSKKISCDVIFFCPTFDIALLKAKNYKNEDYLELDNSDKLNLGNEVLAVGFPKSINSSGQNNIKYTIGILSGHQEGLIQTDAAINPGNSGGPLFYKNKVIGINASKMTDHNVSNIGYAVPINNYKIIKNERKNIIVERPLLNAVISNMDEDILKDISNTNGVYISHVYNDSIFDTISKEFILTKFDTYKIDNYGFTEKRWLNEKIHLKNIINFYRNNSKIPIEYEINKKKLKKMIILKPKQPKVPFIYDAFENYDFLVMGGGVFINLNKNNIYKNKELQYTLNINDLYEEKLIISYILPNSLISVLNNFNHGDIIEEVNDKKVKNLNDLRRILKKEYKINRLKCIKIKNSNNEIVILDYKKTIQMNKQLMNIYQFNNKNIL